jgi:hypothetical protein
VRRNKTVIALTLIATIVPALAACAAQLGEQVPASIGGLPANVPPRTTEQPPYPAVHDVPPARATAPLNDDQQLKLERELSAARARQQKLQDPNAKAKTDKANAANEAAAQKARAAAKSMQKKPSAAPAQ